MAKLSVVGKFQGKYPSLEGLKEWVNAHWRELMDHIPEISVLAKSWFVFRFKIHEDANRILQSHQSFRNTPIMFKKWTPCLMRIVNISTEEVPEMAKLSVVGKVQGKYPSLEGLTEWGNAHWRELMDHIPEISVLGPYTLEISFAQGNSYTDRSNGVCVNLQSAHMHT